MIDLTDKVAFVTGGGSGIGTGIAKVLAGQGADIVVADLDGRSASAVASEVAGTGRKSLAVTIDVTDRGLADSAVGEAMDRFGRIDILVNDAGILGPPGWWAHPTPDDRDWDAALSVNLRGVINVSQAVMPHMQERRYGKIINIASIAGRVGGADVPHYSVSKAAVINWTQANALQLAAFDVNVNAICPGVVWTPMYEQLTLRRTRYVLDPEIQGFEGRDYFEKMVELKIPMKKEQTAEDIGKLAAFLASDDAHNITGQSINVDGGIRMN